MLQTTFHSFAFPEAIIPVIGIIMVFSIPLVAILVRHQQRMTELIHRVNAPQMPSPEVEALRREVAELKQLVQHQTIAIDDLRSRPAIPSPNVDPARFQA